MKPILTSFIGLALQFACRPPASPTSSTSCRTTTPPTQFQPTEGGLPRSPDPNLDRLAKEGALFENAFAPIPSAPLPGLRSDRTIQPRNGAVDLSGRVMPGKQMLAIEMGKAGYETAMIGKWHLKVEPKDFDYYCVCPAKGSTMALFPGAG